VCLEVLVQIAEGVPGRIGAKRLGQISGLVVTSARPHSKPALDLSVSGHCSCGFLGKGRSHDQGVWELDLEQVPKLAAAVLALNSEARKYRLLAHWLGGDTDRTERRITGGELLKLVESSQLGDNVIYRTWSDPRAPERC
jgi:hypothetical protein